MSDEILIGVALYSNPDAVGPNNRNVAMAVSLNHHIWIHDPNIKVDEWIIGDRKTSCGAGGRVLISQRMWNHKTDRLVMSCTQEALIRLRGETL